MQVPKTELTVYGSSWSKKRRFEHVHKDLQEQLCTARPAKRTKIDKEYSIQRIPSALWDFADGGTEQGSSIQAFSYDAMHNEDLGVFLYIIAAVRPYLQKRYGKSIGEQKEAECNARLRALMHLVRADDFSLPTCEEGYFRKSTLVQAKDHRNVMQVLPHIFWGIDDDLTVVSIRLVPSQEYFPCCWITGNVCPYD